MMKEEKNVFLQNIMQEKIWEKEDVLPNPSFQDVLLLLLFSLMVK